MTYRSPAAPNLHLILFSWCCLHSRMGRRGHRRGHEVPHPPRNSARAPNNPNPFSHTARRRNDRLFPRRSKNIYAEETCGRENTIRWDTNRAFALIFSPFLCFKSSRAKFFTICSCRSRAEFVEQSITAITEEGKSLRDARWHPQGANTVFLSTWTGSSPSGCSFTQ